MEQKYMPHKREGYEGTTQMLDGESESIGISTPESILESYSSLEDSCSIPQNGWDNWTNWDRWDRWNNWPHSR